MGRKMICNQNIQNIFKKSNLQKIVLLKYHRIARKMIFNQKIGIFDKFRANWRFCTCAFQKEKMFCVARGPVQISILS